METPVYSPAWTEEQSHAEFRRRMDFMFYWHSSPVWRRRPVDKDYNREITDDNVSHRTGRTGSSQ
jgi:hypothetical protein